MQGCFISLHLLSIHIDRVFGIVVRTLTVIQKVLGSIPAYTLEFFSGSIGSGTGSTQPREANWVAT